MNFHLLTDNPVYIDYFIEMADSIKESKDYYILLKDKSDIKHVKSSNINFFNIEEAVEYYNTHKFEKIFIHYLNNDAIKFINFLDNEVPIYWIFWGADGYRHPKLNRKIYLPETRKLLNKLNPKSFQDLIGNQIRNLILERKLNKVFKRINYCCTQVKGDYDLIKSVSPDFSFEHKFFAYRGVNSDKTRNETGEKENNRKGYNILLGNSANPTNNHLDILKILLNYKENVESIICPLSYSGSEKYVKMIVEYGNENFGDKFRALENFLPLEEYNDIMNTIDIGIFYHSRQQAYSNTLLVLEKGNKILMNPTSTLYKMYRDLKINNVYEDFDKLLNSSHEENNKLLEFFDLKNVKIWYSKLLTN